MTRQRFPDAETSRLEALAAYQVLDQPGIPAVDALTRLAAKLCGVPIAIVCLVDSDRQWFLAAHGMAGKTESRREHAFCEHAIRETGLLHVEDARLDARFAENPLVTGEPNVRFYAGVPLVDDAGFALGTLCVLDSQPRVLTPEQSRNLSELAGAVMGILAGQRTASELRMALKTSAELAGDLELVLDSVPARVAYTDRGLRNRFSNTAYARTFGRTRESLEGAEMRDLVGEAIHAQDLSHSEAVLRGERQSFERTVTTAQGDRHDFDVVYSPDVRDGEVRGFVTSLSEVTDHKLALRGLARRNALLAMAEEVAAIGHWRLDLEGSRLYWSPQVFAIHERESPDPPSVEDAIDCYHPDDRAVVAVAVQRAIDHAEPFDFDLRLVLPGGRTRRVHSKGRAEVDPVTGRTRAIFGVFQDVSEREALRERIKRQERLVTTGTLAAGVGHEINNPLTFVSANVNFALDEIRSIASASPSDRMREILEALAGAREGAERIRKIVRGLRAFAREDTIAIPTDVHSTIAMSVSMARHELRRRVTLVVDPTAVSPVLADESRLSQVFVNLLVNAAHAFSSANTELNQVHISASDVDDDHVAVEITDNGTGIRDEVLGRIFDPFFTTKPVGEGTGLGLAICHSIVSSLGGELSVRTKLHRGTTFRVVLPAAKSIVHNPGGTCETPPSAHRGRVMLIDDEEAIVRAQPQALDK